MPITDLTADMLTVLRNAARAQKETAEIKRSGLIEAILKILKDEGFISNYKSIEDKRQGLIKVYLKYNKDKTPAIRDIKKITRPGLKVYKSCKKLPRVLGGIGIAIISTSQGVMTADEARKRRIGGEVICHAW